MINNLNIDQNVLRRFCKLYHIKKLSLFGSVLTKDFSEHSDIDMLVEFEEGCKPGYIKYSRITRELSQIVNRQVDLKTPAELSKYFREKVILNSKIAYAG